MKSLKCFLVTAVLVMLSPMYGQDAKQEKDIRVFIENNMNKYELTPEKIAQLRQALADEEHEHDIEFSPAHFQNIIDDMKRVELTKLYYSGNATYSLESEEVVYICDNGNFDIKPGFENYTFGYDALINVPFGCGLSESLLTTYNPPTAFNSFNDHVTLVDNNASISGGYDPVLHALTPPVDIPRVYSENYAIKLNNNSNGFGVTSMSKKFKVTGPIVSYNFSLIVQNPLSHDLDEQPYFVAKLVKSDGTVLAANCIVADVGNTGLFNNADNDLSAPLLYTDWQCNILQIQNDDFQEVLGEIVELVFIITDCGQGAHYGTVYIDDICDSNICDPAYGTINLDLDIESGALECPQFPFNICGDFTPPHTINTDPVIYGSVNSIKLEIIASDGVTVINTLVNPVITGNDFCFEINEADFPTPVSGEYGLRVYASFDMTGNTWDISNPPIGIAPSMDIKFIDCCVDCIDVTANVAAPTYDKKEADVCIKANNTIDGGASASYHAGYEVVLQAGFTASYTSTDRFYIEECSGAFALRNWLSSDNLETESKINLVKISDDFNGIQIYPNPTEGELNILTGDVVINAVKLTTLDGKSIHISQQSNNGNYRLDMNSVSQGVYLLTIEMKNGEVITRKIIKQ